MDKDAAALLLLLPVGILAIAGLYLLFTGTARSAELAARADADTADPLVRRLVRRADASLRRTGGGQRLGTWLRGAGVPFSALDFVALVAAVTLIAWLLGRLLLPGFVAGLFGLAVGVGGGRWYVERKRAQRRDEFISQLPELARILSNGTQAGLSMAGAVQLAARELDDPAGAEMRSVLDEMRVGRALDDALESLRERLPSREVAVLMTTIVIQQRAGGDTVRALQELGATLEARKDLLREIRTLLSGSVFTSYVVAGIGIGTIVIVNVITPGVLREMTSTPLGIVALATAGILWAIAAVLIRSTTRVEA